MKWLGHLIYENGWGVHPELGPDFYGSFEEYQAALYWQAKLYPIEDEI